MLVLAFYYQKNRKGAPSVKPFNPRHATAIGAICTVQTRGKNGINTWLLNQLSNGTDSRGDIHHGITRNGTG